MRVNTLLVSWGWFTNVSQALQSNLTNIYNARNHSYGENFKLKQCTCSQSMALGTRTKVQLEIPIRNIIQKFRETILESSRNVSDTPLCKSNGTFFSDMGINELTSVLHKYKTPVTKCCILTCCCVNLVCIRHLIVKIMPEKHVWGPDFLMPDSLYIFQLFEN